MASKIFALQYLNEELEALEEAFKTIPEVVTESMSAEVLRYLRKDLEQREEDCTFLEGKDEDKAIRMMNEFGTKPISKER